MTARTLQQKTGTRGEQEAADWLENNQYQIIEQNYFARVGEIDIIARYIPTKRLCFFEVKTRKYRDGSAEAAVHSQKREKIRRAAIVYCKEKGILPHEIEISFEHVSVYTHEKEKHIDHYILPMT